MTYNGWTNYETWNVNLWLANDEPMYRETLRRVQAGRTVRAYVEEIIAEHGRFGDLGRDPEMTLAEELAIVDWDEIEAAWVEE